MTSKRELERRLDDVDGRGDLPDISLAQLLSYPDELDFIGSGRCRLHGQVYRIAPSLGRRLVDATEVDNADEA